MNSTKEAAPPPNGSSGDSSVPPPASLSPPPPPSTSPPPSSSSPPSPPPPSPQHSPPPPPPKDSSDKSPPKPSPSHGASSPPPPTNSKSNSPPPSKSPPPPPPPTSWSHTPEMSPSPPPPWHSQKTPASPSRSHKGVSSSSNASDEVALEIGIAVAAGIFFLALLALILTCCLVKKRKRDPYYYGDLGKGGDYYNGGHWHHGVSPPPPPMMQGGGGGLPPPPGSAWPPPPPQPVMNPSTEMPSSLFSGPRPTALPPPSSNIALGFTKSTFNYDELAHATNGFSPANMLGQGGFGYVYKGVLPNGKEIAVKQLKSGSGQGEREFQAEVEIISRVHHRHLVSLVGYCIAANQRMLVYEFVPNNTLEHHLHGKGRPTMDWETRLRIALGSARGLAYLHEDCHPRIIHRDIKAANILLDHKFEAQVADFGLAKLSEDTHTHVSTRVMGTFGYLAPEYASSGKLTEKSDVFSFGVMLLELITGRKPVDPTGMEDSLVEWARPLLQKAMEEGDYDELVDPRLENYNPEEMAHLVACAAGSVRHSSRRRPRMTQIVRALEGDMSLEYFNEGLKRGQGSNMTSSTFSGEYESGNYNKDMSKFRKMAFEQSGEFDSTDYSQQMSGEYGPHASGSSSEFSRDMGRPGGHRRNPSKQ